jgi:hypothetical protein
MGGPSSRGQRAIRGSQPPGSGPAPGIAPCRHLAADSGGTARRRSAGGSRVPVGMSWLPARGRRQGRQDEGRPWTGEGVTAYGGTTPDRAGGAHSRYRRGVPGVGRGCPASSRSPGVSAGTPGARIPGGRRAWASHTRRSLGTSTRRGALPQRSRGVERRGPEDLRGHPHATAPPVVLVWSGGWCMPVVRRPHHVSVGQHLLVLDHVEGSDAQ